MQTIDPSRADDRPIVLIHGFLGAPDDWNVLRDELTSADSIAAPVCITIDLLLTARRIRAQTQGSRMISLTELVQQISNDLDADERTSHGYDIAGYSMGGRIALEMTEQPSAQRLRTRAVPPLSMLLSAHPGLDFDNERDERAASDDRLAERLTAIAMATDPTIRRELAGVFLDEWYRQPLFSSLRERDHFAQFLRRRQDVLATGDCAALWAAIVAGCSSGRAVSRWDVLARRADECSMIVGDQDGRYVAVANRARTIGVRVELLPDSGHALHLEQPARLAKQLIQLRLDRGASFLRGYATR